MSTVSGYQALSLAVTRDVTRNKVGLFFTFLFPLIFLLVIGLSTGRAAYGTGRYIDYVGPGVMAWAVANGALFGVAYTMIQWRRSEVLRLIRMTPTSVPTVLGSRYAVAVGVGVVQAVFFTAIAALPWLGLHVSLRGFAALPVLLLGISAFLTLGLIVGTYAKSSEAVAAISNCIMVPMAFVSGTFYPVSGLPHWMQTFSLAFPLRYLSDGVGGVLTGKHGAGTIVIPCLVLAGFTLVFGLFATKAFRWSNDA